MKEYSNGMTFNHRPSSSHFDFISYYYEIYELELVLFVAEKTTNIF